MLNQLQKKEHLICEWIKILETQKSKLLERKDSDGNDCFMQNSCEGSQVLAAGFYSWNENDDLEQDLQKDEEEPPFNMQMSYDIRANPKHNLGDITRISSYLNFTQDGGLLEEPNSVS